VNSPLNGWTCFIYLFVLFALFQVNVAVVVVVAEMEQGVEVKDHVNQLVGIAEVDSRISEVDADLAVM